MPLLVDHGGAVEGSSASKESGEKEAEDKEAHAFFYLQSVACEHRHVKQDSATIMHQ